MIFGESGGAYITAGVGMMLGERNEGHLVKLQFLQIPMIDDFICYDNPSPPLNVTEKASCNFQRGVYDALKKGGCTHVQASPNHQPDSVCQKGP